MKILKIKNIDLNFTKKELEKGKVFVVPTDTSYGISGKIDSKVVTRIFKIKERSQEKAMPVFVDKEIVEQIAIVDKRAKILMTKFWPGPLTMVLTTNPPCKVGPCTVGQEGTVAVREPKNKLIRDILKIYKKPITATSANISGKPSAYKPSEILNYFAKSKITPDYFIDAGVLPQKPVSTIIDLTDKLKILREGEIKFEDIKKEL